MANSPLKITLSRSQDIPFNKLVLSQANVRRVKEGVTIEQLAEDIALRTLLQSLSVRPILDADGNETGMYEVPVGGRRYRALELLVKQKRLVKTAPVPCVIRTDGLGVEDSLAENVQRAPLHPLDQFRAFQSLREAGLSEEDIAARFFVNPSVVKQRLRLVSVSPKLLEAYAEDQMTLEQLMAFSITGNHERQEQVWEGLAHAFNKEPFYIRRLLTEEAVPAGDKRAQFIGLDAYVTAGGAIMRDLFQNDEGGWLQDPILLDRLTIQKLNAEAQTLRDEGWKWIEAALDFPYGHTHGLRRLAGEEAPWVEDELISRQAIQDEFDRLTEVYAGAEDLPDEVDQRLSELETALAAIQDRSVSYTEAEKAQAGAFISIDASGSLRIERGFVRPEDEQQEPESDNEDDEDSLRAQSAMPLNVAQGAMMVASDPDDDGPKPLSERLVMELTAHRTLALRNALGQDSETAFVAVLHALCLSAFYPYAGETCLEITGKSSSFAVQAPGLADCVSAKAITERHDQWTKVLPEDPADLWDVLQDFDQDRQVTLFAHCAGLTVNLVHEPWRHSKGKAGHGDRLAQAVHLDMVAAGWAPTAENYLARVPKIRILDAVREAKGDQAARHIEGMTKPVMAAEAERLLNGSGWLPEILRATPSWEDTPDQPEPHAQAAE